MSNKGKGTIKIVISVLLIALFAYLGLTVLDASKTMLANGTAAQSGEESSSSVKLGLDLAGGVSITYQAVQDNPSEEDMDDTVYKLQQRVENYSTEAEVYKENNNRINIDIPGVSDANAILEELGKPGSLQFFDEDFNLVLEGTDVASSAAQMTKSQTTGQTEYMVALTLTDEGAKKFAEATAANVGKTISIVYDGETKSAPIVQEAITGGQCVINGMADYEEADLLAKTIRIGSLSLELEEIRSNVVGAKLGQDAFSSSITAAGLGLIILFIILIVAFRLPGVAASLALILYTALEVLLISVFKETITLTLSGIAGVILSIGMAVDANCIISTRIKEEIGKGKTPASAIKLGYKKALSAIIDGNVTTLIVAIVLMLPFSPSVVKSFAQTLALGIILSMITALFVTRFILNSFVDLGFDNPKLFGAITERKTIDFVGKRKVFFAISVAVVLLGFVFMGINKGTTGDILNYGIDFKGGTSTTVTFNEDMSLDEISAKVVPVVGQVTKDAGIQTQKVTGTNDVIIKTRTLNVSEREELHTLLGEEFAVDVDKITEENISGTISSETKSKTVLMTVIALLCMLIYIFIRFKNMSFAFASVVPLIHDVLVVVTFYAVVKWSVGSTFIAGMLTLVGYSINATIVVFDRIRETVREAGKSLSKAEIVNRSITETLSRSIYSSLTTFVMITALYVFGVSTIKEFALPIMVGVVCGTYSSICIAGALWYIFSGKEKKAKAK